MQSTLYFCIDMLQNQLNMLHDSHYPEGFFLQFSWKSELSTGSFQLFELKAC